MGKLCFKTEKGVTSQICLECGLLPALLLVLFTAVCHTFPSRDHMWLFSLGTCVAVLAGETCGHTLQSASWPLERAGLLSWVTIHTLKGHHSLLKVIQWPACGFVTASLGERAVHHLCRNWFSRCQIFLLLNHLDSSLWKRRAGLKVNHLEPLTIAHAHRSRTHSGVPREAEEWAWHSLSWCWIVRISDVESKGTGREKQKATSVCSQWVICVSLTRNCQETEWKEQPGTQFGPWTRLFFCKDFGPYLFSAQKHARACVRACVL